LLALLDKADAELRTTVYFALTFYNSPACLDAFLKGLHSPHPQILQSSMTGMRSILPRIAKTSRRDAKRRAKFAKLIATLCAGAEKALADGNLANAVRYMDLLGLTGSRKAALFLHGNTNHARPDVRAGAVSGLGSLGNFGRRYSADIIKALKDDRFIVRLRAVQAAGKLGLGAAVPAIIDMLKVKNVRLRTECVKTLCALTGKNFGPYPDLWRKWWDKLNEKQRRAILNRRGN